MFSSLTAASPLLLSPRSVWRLGFRGCDLERCGCIPRATEWEPAWSYPPPDQVRVQRQAQQVVERNGQIVDLQALHKGGLLGIESGGATLQGNLLQRLAPLHVAQTFLQLDLACGHFFLRSLLFELRNEDAVVELANLESNLILGLIYLRPRALDISSRGAIGFANSNICVTGCSRPVPLV